MASKKDQELHSCEEELIRVRRELDSVREYIKTKDERLRNVQILGREMDRRIVSGVRWDPIAKHCFAEFGYLIEKALND